MFEYRVIPAPNRGQKARGIRTPADRFANAIELKMNELAAEGWEYLRADTLPSEERQGLKGRKTVYQSVLVFRRVQDVQAPAFNEPPLTASDSQHDDPEFAHAIDDADDSVSADWLDDDHDGDVDGHDPDETR